MLEKLDLGIKKITIPLPFALNHVHCFVAPGDNGWTVMDTGLNREQTATIWKDVLGKKPVERIILTHLHPDHVGYSGTLQQQTGAKVWMSERDSNDVKRVWTPDAKPYIVDTYEKAAVPPEIATGIIQNIDMFFPFVLPLPEVNHYLEDKAEIVIGNATYEVFATPGHAAGLVVFFNREKGVLLSTDHILPRITPNVAHWFYGEKNPLQSFENSLKRIKKLHAEYVIPSHGDPFIDANKRIDEIWEHHEQRLDETLEVAKQGITAFDLCSVIFRRKLSVYDYQFAVGEAIAHLIYLEEKNMIKKDLIQGVWQYHYNY